MTDRQSDSYCATFRDYESFIREINDMEQNSRWIPGVVTSEMRLQALYPIEISEKAAVDGLDPALAMDTALYGTHLTLSAAGQTLLVRDTALPTLQEAARISGTALGRMSSEAYSTVLNEGFKTSGGSSLLLERYGKLSACHSGSGTGYEIMPVSELLEITGTVLRDKFGTAEFRTAFNSHSLTCAVWALPDAQDTLVNIYQKALAEVGVSSCYPVNFMPCVKFCTSDTAASAATLTPVFLMGKDRPIHFMDGIKVRHSRRGNVQSGTGTFEEEAEGIYAGFSAVPETVKRLASISVLHGENAVISLCRRYGIAKRYGEAAREEVCRYSGRNGVINGHDLYLAMTAAVVSAKYCSASPVTVNNIEEALSRIAMLEDFSEHDTGGLVAWAA